MRMEGLVEESREGFFRLFSEHRKDAREIAQSVLTQGGRSLLLKDKLAIDHCVPKGTIARLQEGDVSAFGLRVQ